jgi:hypothetical protein
LDYVKDNSFAEIRYMEILNARKDQVTKISGLTDSEGKPYFSLRYVLDKYLGMTDDDRVANEKAKERDAEKKKKAAEEEAKKAAEAAPAAEEGAGTEGAGTEGGDEFKL